MNKKGLYLLVRWKIFVGIPLSASQLSLDPLQAISNTLLQAYAGFYTKKFVKSHWGPWWLVGFSSRYELYETVLFCTLLLLVMVVIYFVFKDIWETLLPTLQVWIIEKEGDLKRCVFRFYSSERSVIV